MGRMRRVGVGLQLAELAEQGDVAPARQCAQLAGGAEQPLVVALRDQPDGHRVEVHRIEVEATQILARLLLVRAFRVAAELARGFCASEVRRQVPAGVRADDAQAREVDHLVDPLVLDHLHRRGDRVGVGDLAVRLDSLGSERGERSPQATLRVARIASSSSLRIELKSTPRATGRPSSCSCVHPVVGS